MPARAAQAATESLLSSRASARDAKVIDWLAEITADCPKKRACNMSDQCAARRPDLPRVM